MDVFVVFGVSGSGKTTIGRMLSDRLGIPFYDADDYHPQANLDKMVSGEALNDEDRRPWLEELGREIRKWSETSGAILSCSALKNKYRNLLASGSDDVKWVFLDGDRELISNRLKVRKGHFFDGKLLDTQFEALEKPETGCIVSINQPPEKIIDDIINYFQ